MTLFYGKQLDILQPEDGYRISIDAILLAASINTGCEILDVGSGVGTASLCLKKRQSNLEITGVELQHINVELARKNSQNNGLSIQFIQGDIRKDQLNKVFDHVISNPPFYEERKINKPTNQHKFLSNVLSEITLEQWLYFCIKHSNNYITIIHLPEYLDRILDVFSQNLGGIQIYPIFVNKQAKRIIIQGSKRKKTPLMLHQGLILQDQLGYTKEAQEILTGMRGIQL
ncbi:MAG: methyltransferase [Alphaproteobacteria bacterium]|nr:MAG: methyltransferase [Alphaproteobacteria bacterium]